MRKTLIVMRRGVLRRVGWGGSAGVQGSGWGVVLVYLVLDMEDEG